MAKAWSDPTITIVTDADGSAYLMMLNENSSPNSELITLDNLKLSLYPGITDDATGERLKISDTDIIYGANAVYSLTHKYDTRALYLSGGISASDGGNLLLLGGANATQPGDVYIRSGANTFLAWDESAKAGAINTTSSDGSDSGSWTISGGGVVGGSRGGDIRIYGNEHVNTGDVHIYSGNVAGSNIMLSAFGSTSSILMLTDNTTAVIIDNNQKVGIGGTPTADELTLFNTEPTLRFTDTDNNAYAKIISNVGNITISADVGQGQSGSHIQFNIDGTQVANIDVDGTLELAKGQIQFPATQNSSTDGNTLDDYEEGQWTPSVTFGGNAVGQTGSFIGAYVKVGKLVMINCRIGLTAKGSSTGDAKIEGLPFTIDGYHYSPTLRFVNISFADTPNGYATNSQTISLTETLNNGNGSTLTDANFTDTSIITMTMVYRAADP